MRLLESSLRDGVTEAAEVVERWSRLDLAEASHSKAAERCLTYAREFAYDSRRILDRAHSTGERRICGISARGFLCTLVDGVQAYVERERSKVGWRFARGPLIGSIFTAGTRTSKSPKADDVVWTSTATRSACRPEGCASAFLSLRPRKGTGSLRLTLRGQPPVRGLSTALPPDVVLVFDGQGRLHRRGVLRSKDAPSTS